MAYRQYTECVASGSFNSSPIIYSVALGLFTSLTALVGVLLATGGLGVVAGLGIAGIAIVTTLLSFVHWWLYGRLICLGGERCAIGMVISVEPPQEKSGFDRMDSDYSFNLLLPDRLPGATADDVIANAVDGNLIAEQAATSGISLSFVGYKSRTCDADTCGADKCPETAALHCEFEGAGMYIFYHWLIAALGLFIGGTVLGALCLIPIIGWIACLIGAIVLAIALAAVLAGLAHAASDAASPADVDPALGGELHQNGCDGTGADLLVVKGEWVYDSLHDGWNEIHPVRHCQRIGTWNGTWPFPAQAERDKWCSAIGEAGSPLTIDNQKGPENQWTIHPTVDGCQPEDGEPPPIH